MEPPLTTCGLAAPLATWQLEPLDSERIGAPGVEFVNNLVGNTIPPEFVAGDES